MSNQSIETLVENNWHKIKRAVKKQWNDFSENDLEKIDGSYEELVKKLKDTYHLKNDEIQDKFNEIIKELNLDDAKESMGELKDLLYKKTEEAKNKIGKTVKQSVNSVKENTVDAQKNLFKYIQKNPWKALGVAALIGAVASKLINFNHK